MVLLKFESTVHGRQYHVFLNMLAEWFNHRDNDVNAQCSRKPYSKLLFRGKLLFSKPAYFFVPFSGQWIAFSLKSETSRLSSALIAALPEAADATAACSDLE